MNNLRSTAIANPEVVRMAAAVSGLVAGVASLVVWLGGRSPGEQIREVDFRLTRLVDSIRIVSRTQQEMQDHEIASMRDDLMILLTLRCGEYPPTVLRTKQQYKAAARCEVLINTGR